VHRHFSGGACSKIESMTVEIKAKELVESYCNSISIWNLDSSFSLFDIAKQCALIAVDEIVSTLESMQLIFSDRELILKYWQQVKREIESL
jgi:hypothetical protein